MAIARKCMFFCDVMCVLIFDLVGGISIDNIAESTFKFQYFGTGSKSITSTSKYIYIP